MSQQENGACELHNTIIATMPLLVPTAYVVPSLGCKGSPDHLHFTAEGYRELGRRYAEVMLRAEKISEALCNNKKGESVPLPTLNVFTTE